MIIGINVDFIPTDKPLMIFVAEPVCELSAISLTLLYFSEVYISVTLPIIVPTIRPEIIAINASNPPKNTLLKIADAIITKTVAVYSPAFKAFWGSDPSLPLTKKVAITEARIPIAAITSGKRAVINDVASPNVVTIPNVTAETKAPT